MIDQKLFNSALRVFSGFLGNLAAGAVGITLLSHTIFELISRLSSCILFLILAIYLDQRIYDN